MIVYSWSRVVVRSETSDESTLETSILEDISKRFGLSEVSYDIMSFLKSIISSFVDVVF